jgi:hypothetical protein
MAGVSQVSVRPRVAGLITPDSPVCSLVCPLVSTMLPVRLVLEG